MAFDVPGFVISLVIIGVGVWGYGAERKFISYLGPAERVWTTTLGWVINLCLLYMCVAFTFKLFFTRQLFALAISVLSVFLITLVVYLYMRWKISYKLLGREMRQSMDSLRIELEKIAESAPGGADAAGGAKEDGK